MWLFGVFTHTCSYQGVKNVSFGEHCEHVLNGWSRRSYITFFTISGKLDDLEEFARLSLSQ